MITLSNISVKYCQKGLEVTAIENLSTTIKSGEFVSIVGPSGCGKSTLLHLIAGFLKPFTGEARIDGNIILEPGVERGVVFQKFSLFPWETVRGNIEYGLLRKKIPLAERNKIIQFYLEEIHLEEFANSFPNELSGGMQQRVAIARAFANDPKILLMDEPFASLDSQTGLKMRELLLKIWAKNNKTVVFVTHDIDEAIFLADRVLVLSFRPGRILKEFFIDIPRPRSSNFFLQPNYISLRKEISSTISY